MDQQQISTEDRLYKIFANVNDWLKFAEAKNLGLLTLTAAVAFGFTQINLADGNGIKIVGCYIFLPLSLFSFLSALLSLFPILSKIEKGTYVKSWINKVSGKIDKEVKFDNIHYYGYLKELNANEFESEFLKKLNCTDQFNQFEKDLAVQILYNSRITWLKYQLFKIGAFIFLNALTLSVVALPIVKYFS